MHANGNTKYVADCVNEKNKNSECIIRVYFQFIQASNEND